MESRVSQTFSSDAGISITGSRSTRRKMIPVPTGAGLRVRSTFSPVCRPTPVAPITVFKVRCRIIQAQSPIFLKSCGRVANLVQFYTQKTRFECILKFFYPFFCIFRYSTIIGQFLNPYADFLSRLVAVKMRVHPDIPYLPLHFPGIQNHQRISDDA